MDSIERLQHVFEKFPGIGPRQASRFVHFLLRSSPALRRELAREIEALGKHVKQCEHCKRFFAGESSMCTICASPRRDEHSLAIVSSDTDLDAIERSGTFSGRYFVLGGAMSLTPNNDNSLPNERALLTLVKKRSSELSEVILAFPANPEGDATKEYIYSALAPFAREGGFKITTLGRGLSTGSELEYADPETIKNALAGRK